MCAPAVAAASTELRLDRGLAVAAGTIRVTAGEPGVLGRYPIDNTARIFLWCGQVIHMRTMGGVESQNLTVVGAINAPGRVAAATEPWCAIGTR